MSEDEKKSVGRPRTFFSEGELANARIILSCLLLKPQPCVCGNIDYYFGVYSGSGIVAKCCSCGYRRRYNPYSQTWGPR